MIYCPYPFDQWMTPKKISIKHHVEAHFEDPIKGDFFNYALRKDLTLDSECVIRKGLHFFYSSPGGADGRFDI